MASNQEQKTVDQKLKECKDLCIQNLEKQNTITKQMVFKFLQDNHWDQRVKSIKVNPKLGVAGLEFIDHESAKLFYETFNFEGKIILRPFNIYFHLTLNENEMKKYYIEGITEQTQRATFDAANKIGVCKLYTNYGPTNRSKLKPTGIISFNRKEDLKEQQQKQLQESLEKLGIKLNKYVSDSNLKCSIRLSDFYKGDLNEEDDKITENAKKQIQKEIRPLVKDNFSGIHITVKRKEAQQKQETKKQILVSGLIEFNDFETTIQNFQLLREHFLSDPKTKAILFFHGDENNSYISLFTSGLYKSEDISSDKAFENALLESFRQVNKNVVQVLVFPVKRNNTYVARVYLKSAQDGKDFIVDYTNKRDCFAKFYKDKNYISFNINVDNKLMAKIKQHQRRVGQIQNKIKNAQEQIKRANNRSAKPQIMPIPGNPAMFNQGMVMNPRMNPMQGMNPIVGGMNQMQGMNPIVGGMNQMQGINPMQMQMGMGNIGGIGGMGGIGMVPPPMQMGGTNLKANVDKLKKDKQILMRDPNGKKHIYPIVRRFMVEQFHLNDLDAGKQANQIVNNNSIENLINLLQKPDELKKILSSYQNKN